MTSETTARLLAIKSIRIAAVALLVGILSAIATSSETLAHSGWGGLGVAIWITIFVTFPAFGIFCVFAVIAGIWWLKYRRARRNPV
jgi:hypothetical protein